MLFFVQMLNRSNLLLYEVNPIANFIKTTQYFPTFSQKLPVHCFPPLFKKRNIY